jgi:hypothetical protein
MLGLRCCFATKRRMHAMWDARGLRWLPKEYNGCLLRRPHETQKHALCFDCRVLDVIAGGADSKHCGFKG